MARRLQLKRRIALGFSVASLLGHGSTGAEEIKVDTSFCGSRVHLFASKAPLSEVLRQLSSTLEFELQFEANSDPLLDIDLIREPRDLVATLAPSLSFIIRQERDPRCPGRQRIAKVWFLPQGQGNLRPALAASPPAPRQVPMTREAQEALER